MNAQSRFRWCIALGALSLAAMSNPGDASAQSSPPSAHVADKDARIYVDGAVNAVQGKLNQARQKHDVVMALCLNDKLSQLNAAKQAISSSRDQALIGVLVQRVQQLVGEANQCIGSDQNNTTSGSTVTTIVDSNLPQEPPAGWFPNVLPPGTVTPTAPPIVIPPADLPVAVTAPPECVSPSQ